MGAENSTQRFNAAEFAGTFKGPLSSKYEIMQQLGKGAQGAAYLVRTKDGDVQYVAKETLDMTPEGKEEFKSEFEKMRDMRHPNCAKVIELVEGKELIDGEWKEQLFVISELARGSDLYKYMRKVTNANVILTEEWVAGVYKQAMQGVAYIHSKGIVHNDLKPDNILMLDEFDPSNPSRVPSVVINDFGCATLASDAFFKCGDLRYQSPESWRCIKTIMEGGDSGNFKKLEAKADVWSMGATLFELLSGGLLPFIYRPCSMHDLCEDQALVMALADAIIEQPIQVREHCPGISPEAEDLLLQVFRKDLTERPSADVLLKHSWFAIKGKPMEDSIQWKLEFKETKGIAHRILLNALTTKLQRDHYKDAWQIFQEYDDNNSGSIGINEFKSACTKIGKDALDAEALFHQADIDSNGFLDFNEFMALTFDWKSLDQTALMQNVRKLTMDLDSDGTGDVDAEELSKVFQGMLKPEELREVFQRIDADGNGKISVKEMERFLFDPATEEDLQKYAEEMCRRKAGKAVGPAAHSPEAEEAQLILGVVVPAALCVCMCWHGIVKLF